MKCDFLTGRKVLTCTGNSDIYVPSLFELEEYCQSGKSELCPFLSNGDSSMLPENSEICST